MKPDLLAAADVLLSPVDNTQETFGLSLLEAQAAGLPVVASRFDGYKDLVDDGVDGFLVDTWWCEADPLAGLVDVMDPNVAQLIQAQSVAIDMAQLADRVLRLIADEALRAAMGRRGREKVDREYRFSAIVRRYEALWDDLAREAARVGLPSSASSHFSGRQPVQLGAARLFNHYATRTIAPDDRSSPPPRRSRPAARRRSTPPTTKRVRCCTTRSPRCSTPPRNRSRAADLIALAGDPADRAWFTLLWLVKYDLLRLVR